MSVAEGVIDLFNLPRLTDLVRSITVPSALANPYSGAGALNSLVAGKPAYGLKWSVQTAPASAGRSSRSIVFYQEPFLALSMHYIFADASDFIGDSLLSQSAEGFIVFEFGQPSVVDYDILAGWTLNFAWLVAP